MAESPELDWRSLPHEGAPQLAAPLGLTATDGTGLRLVSMSARAVVAEPLAFTELHLTFENPSDRMIEGHFTIDLPTGSAISRFAMKIDERWQEGEVVERQAARAAYEDFLHRKQDPALLENQSGNRFSARVFPIPARGRKELIVAYSQALPDSRVPYELMLAGLPKLDQLDVEIRVEGADERLREVIAMHERDYVPVRNIEVHAARADRAVGLRSDGLAVARVQATGPSAAGPLEDLTILFDTSASRALDFDGQVRRLGKLVERLREDGDFPLRVVAFDQDVSLVFDGRAREFGQRQLDALYTRSALGASDLESALRRIAPLGPATRVLVMTDGIATAGDAEAAALADAARALAGLGVQRLDAIIDGGLQDRETLTALTTAGLEHDGIVVDARLEPTEIAAKLRRSTLPAIEVSVPDASFVWPRTVRGMQPGDELLVYAEVPPSAGMTVVLTGTDEPHSVVDLVPAERPLLERALVGARIDALTLDRSELGEDATELRKALQQRIVALSTKHRVLSDFTGMLVLETEADYQRFAIDRNALADILVVGERGVDVMRREAGGAPAFAPVGPREAIPQMARTFDPAAPQQGEATGGVAWQEAGSLLASPYGGAFAVGSDDGDVWGGLTGTEIGEAFGVGGLGLVGTGRGGGGVGESTIRLADRGWVGIGDGDVGRIGDVGRRARAPRVRLATHRVTGALDKDIVRRIVRSHRGEVVHCYNLGLAAEPALEGRVEVQFAIGPDGRVPIAVIASTTLADTKVGQCVAKAVKRWRFPRPSDGRGAVVDFPFELTPGGPPSAEALAQADAIRGDQARDVQLLDLRPLGGLAPATPLTGGSPYVGRMSDIMTLIEGGRHAEALSAAQRWHHESPGDVVALVAMGEALERLGKLRTAARVYGSLIDLFPARADMRRYAGQRLDRVGDEGRRLAVDTYRQAVAQRPDHPNSHRLYAWALVRDHRLEEAFDAILVGIERRYPAGRFAGVDRVLREDAGLIAAALIDAEPSAAGTVLGRLMKAGGVLPSGPSTRFVMSWETDANDVDFHVTDGAGGHAFFGQPALATGGSLYADVTTGYGPECFTIEGTPNAFPYRFEANFFARGPMGYGMGTLQIVEHDGEGGFAFTDRPFILMKDRAAVNLGELAASSSFRAHG
ncbi:MAG: AgmX/PglI C-terminal domain-containing protein [Nannocystaceae bacterium]|nr:AgmX/PglI C-terminal domain-containing protein [Nannocystaceae bacterium]